MRISKVCKRKNRKNNKGKKWAKIARNLGLCESYTGRMRNLKQNLMGYFDFLKALKFKQARILPRFTTFNKVVNLAMTKKACHIKSFLRCHIERVA